MMPKIILILFLAIALSGCVDTAPADNPGQEDESVTDESKEESAHEPEVEYTELDEEFLLINETKIIRFKTDHEDGIKINSSIESRDEEWRIGVFVQGKGYTILTSFSKDLIVHFNDESMTLLPDGESWNLNNTRWPGPGSPGEHVIAFQAMGMTASFRAISANATYEVLENETMSYRYITPDHPDWDRDTYISAGYVTRFEGTIKVAPELNSVDVHVTLWGDDGSLKVELTRGNEFVRCPTQKTSNSEVSGTHTDEATQITAKTTFVGPNHVVQLHVVDWSLDLQKNMCSWEHFT